MKFDFQKSMSEARASLDAAINPDRGQHGSYWQAFAVAKLAFVGLPRRQLSIAYVLGVMAGIEFDLHDKVPPCPFAHKTAEAEDYVLGIKDALLISGESRGEPLEFGEIFQMIFGGGK